MHFLGTSFYLSTFLLYHLSCLDYSLQEPHRLWVDTFQLLLQSCKSIMQVRRKICDFLLTSNSFSLACVRKPKIFDYLLQSLSALSWACKSLCHTSWSWTFHSLRSRTVQCWLRYCKWNSTQRSNAMSRPFKGSIPCWSLKDKDQSFLVQGRLSHTFCWKRIHLRWGQCRVQSHQHAYGLCAVCVSSNLGRGMSENITFQYLPNNWRKKWRLACSNSVRWMALFPSLARSGFEWTYTYRFCSLIEEQLFLFHLRSHPALVLLLVILCSWLLAMVQPSRQ